MIKLFKVKEKEREFAENAGSICSTFSNMSIDENAISVCSTFSNMSIDERANSYVRAPIEKQSPLELFMVNEQERGIAESAINISSIFSNMNIAEKANYYGTAPIKKQSLWELRLNKDICELRLPKTTAIVFPNGRDGAMHFNVYIWPDEGFYSGGVFLFTFEVSPTYPHEAPKVNCKTKVYHPNIDLQGNVRLNILGQAWNPVLSINTIINGLHHLFLQPNPEHPLNHDAAQVLWHDPQMFEQNVKRAMAGDFVGRTWFRRCIDSDVHTVLLTILKDPKAVVLL